MQASGLRIPGTTYRCDPVDACISYASPRYLDIHIPPGGYAARITLARLQSRHYGPAGPTRCYKPLVASVDTQHLSAYGASPNIFKLTVLTVLATDQ